MKKIDVSLWLSGTVFLYPILGIAFSLAYLIYKTLTSWREPFYPSPLKDALLCGLIAGALGYNMLGAGTSDITVYFIQITDYFVNEIPYVLARDADFLYTRDLLFAWAAYARDIHLVPFVVGFSVYALAFYVLLDQIRRIDRPIAYWKVVLLGVVMVYVVGIFLVINNTRNVFAFVLISFAVYREIVQKKLNFITILFYILPLGLHTAALVLLFVRFIAVPVQRMRWIFLSFAFLMPLFVEFAYEYVSVLGALGILGEFIGRTILKAYFFLNWTEGGFASQVVQYTSYYVQRYYGGFILCVFLLLMFVNRKSECFARVKNNLMTVYLYIVIVMALASLSIVTGAFWRFEALVLLFCPIFLLPCIAEINRPTRYLLALWIPTLLPLVLYTIKYEYNAVAVIESLDAMAGMNYFTILWHGLVGGYAVITSFF